MKKSLVTGGAGFLGSNLCEKLLSLGHFVIVLDDLSTGREQNIKSFLSNSRFKFMKHDIVNPIDLQVDQIFNLACPASPPHYQKDPVKTTKTNIYGVINMLELAKKNNAKILQASTSEVYGDPEQHPQKESYRGNVNPIGIRSCYDEGKRCAESLFFDYYRKHKVKIKVVRIFNTYGPNMDPDDGRVVSNFIVSVLQNKPISMYGDGTQTRSFCFVDDMIDGFIAMMDSEKTTTGPINLGSCDEFNLLQLSDLVLKLIGNDSKIIFESLPADDPTRRRPDISKAKKILNWQPKVKLQDGLLKTIEYFKKELSKE